MIWKCRKNQEDFILFAIIHRISSILKKKSL